MSRCCAVIELYAYNNVTMVYKQRNKDVGMGLMSQTLCLRCRHLLVPNKIVHEGGHPYIPLHFIEMIFPLVLYYIRTQNIPPTDVCSSLSKIL